MVDLITFQYLHKKNHNLIEYHLKAGNYDNGNLALSFLGRNLNSSDFDKYLQPWCKLSINVSNELLDFNEFVVDHDFDLDLLKSLIVDFKYIEDTKKRINYGFCYGNPICKLNKELSSLVVDLMRRGP